MLFRRIKAHVEKENWFAVVVDFIIVVVGVYIGIQVANWNDTRIQAERRAQIIESLITNLDNTTNFQLGMTVTIKAGLSEWTDAYARGEKPIPYYYRIAGSDTAPDVWSTFEQMQLADLFDPVTLFDLIFHYSELDGIGQKYLRYISFVENEILPGEIVGRDYFYAADGTIKPEFQANMDRLREYSEENEIINKWAECLAYRLRTVRTFAQVCKVSNYILDGMKAADKPVAATP